MKSAMESTSCTLSPALSGRFGSVRAESCMHLAGHCRSLQASVALVGLFGRSSPPAIGLTCHPRPRHHPPLSFSRCATAACPSRSAQTPAVPAHLALLLSSHRDPVLTLDRRTDGTDCDAHPTTALFSPAIPSTWLSSYPIRSHSSSPASIAPLALSTLDQRRRSTLRTCKIEPFL
jgi:hypothetical protein